MKAKEMRELNKAKAAEAFKKVTGMDISNAGYNIPIGSRLKGDERKVAKWNKQAVIRPMPIMVQRANRG